MNFKSLITAFAIGIFASASYADTIDVVNGNRIGGVSHKILENIVANSDGAFGEIRNFGTCAEVVNYMSNTDRPTITSWDILRHATSEDKTCDYASLDTFVTVYGRAYFNVCTLTERAENSLERFVSGNARFGVNDYFTDIVQVENILEGVGSNASIVRYPASPELLAALEIGEVDFIYTTRKRENMTCVLTMDPNTNDGTARAIDYFDNSFATAAFTAVILGANVDPNQVRELIAASAQSEQWVNEFPHYDTSALATDSATQFKQLTVEIDEFNAAAAQ
jgi:hypothetical protein